MIGSSERRYICQVTVFVSEVEASYKRCVLQIMYHPTKFRLLLGVENTVPFFFIVLRQLSVSSTPIRAKIHHLVLEDFPLCSRYSVSRDCQGTYLDKMIDNSV